MATVQEAKAAVECHQRAIAASALDFAVAGVFDGWHWWQGSTRIAWLPPGGGTVYKIEKFPTGLSNEFEHQKMSEWRDRRHAWAPQTWLFDFVFPPVLAMPYYPDPITSEADIPESIHAVRVDDMFLANFRRGVDGQVMLIDAG